MSKVITPEEAHRRMLELSQNQKGVEVRHCYADALLCDTLRSLGYEEAVEVFEKMEKWYS